MRKASRQIVFINTSLPEERVELLKPLGDIKEMDDDCEDIYTSGVLKRYSKGTAKVEHLTLTDWDAWYDESGKAFVKSTNELDAELDADRAVLRAHYQLLVWNDDSFAITGGLCLEMGRRGESTGEDCKKKLVDVNDDDCNDEEDDVDDDKGEYEYISESDGEFN